MIKINARDTLNSPKILAYKYFGELLNNNDCYDYQFVDIQFKNLMVIGGFKYQIPAFKELYKNEIVGNFLNRLANDKSHLFIIDWDLWHIIHYIYLQGDIEI